MISAILLAAGESRRMGQENKLIFQLGKSTLIKKVVKSYCKASFSEILVVVGYEWKKITQELAGLPISLIYNENYRTGMTSSIHKGLQHMVSSTGFLLGTTDTPGISIKHLDNLLKAYETNFHNQLIIRSHAGEIISHPSVFAPSYKSLLQDCDEPNGCKSVIQNYRKHWLLVETEETVLVDIDTQQEYKEWISNEER